jgi:hypothetical protein
MTTNTEKIVEYGAISQRCDRHFDKRGLQEGKKKPSTQRRKKNHKKDKRLEFEAGFTSDERLFDDRDDDFVSVVSEDDEYWLPIFDELEFDDFRYNMRPNDTRPFPLDYKPRTRWYWMVGNRLSLDTFRLVRTTELFHMFFDVKTLSMTNKFEIHKDDTFEYISECLRILSDEFQEQMKFYTGVVSCEKNKQKKNIPRWLRRFGRFPEEQFKNGVFEIIQRRGIPISKYEIQYLYKCFDGSRLEKMAFVLFVADLMMEMFQKKTLVILSDAFKKQNIGGHYEMYEYITKFM